LPGPVLSRSRAEGVIAQYYWGGVVAILTPGTRLRLKENGLGRLTSLDAVALLLLRAQICRSRWRALRAYFYYSQLLCVGGHFGRPSRA